MADIVNSNVSYSGLVQKYIGTAYDNVKIVADNIDSVNVVAQLGSLPELEALADQIHDDADRAEAAAINATASETSAANSANSAVASASSASASKTASALSETNARNSEIAAVSAGEHAVQAAAAAKISETNSKASENNSKISEDNAKVSEDNSKVSETDAEQALSDFEEQYTSSDLTPPNPDEGFLWWDSVNDKMKVWNNVGWIAVTTPEYTSQNTPPIGPKEGDLWWDETTNEFKVFDGVNWHTVTGIDYLSQATPPVGSEGQLWWDTTNSTFNVYTGTSWYNVSTASSEAVASALAAKASEDAAGISATNADASAALAVTSANGALASENNALIYASNALTSENKADASATNASTSAADSANSSASAGVSAGAAAASYDDFDDRYLGPYAVDPTTDNDNNAILVGALYFNTNSNAMMVYTTNSIWIPVVDGDIVEFTALATHIGNQPIELDINVMDWTGEPYSDGRSLHILQFYIVYFANDTNKIYKWVGPKNVKVGLDGDYLATGDDLQLLGLNSHDGLVNRDLPDAHPISAVTGLQAALDNVTGDHRDLSHIGTNTHIQLDSHLSNNNLHFEQSAISITESQISDLIHTPVINLLSNSSTVDALSANMGRTLDINKSNIGHNHTAKEVNYDNANSGLVATDVKDAIDELVSSGGIIEYSGIATHVGSNTIEQDINAMDWTGHAHTSGTTLYIENSHIVTFGNGLGVSYRWLGPKGVKVGLGGDYVVTSVDLEVIAVGEHNTLAGRNVSGAHPISSISGLQDSLDLKANNDSPTLTGNPRSVTPPIGDGSTKIATTAFVLQNSSAGVVNSVVAGNNITVDNVDPENPVVNSIQIPVINDLITGGISDALSAQMGVTLNNSISLKANIDNPVFTGVPSAATAPEGTDTTQLATTAFVLANGGTGGGTGELVGGDADTDYSPADIDLISGDAATVY